MINKGDIYSVWCADTPPHASGDICVAIQVHTHILGEASGVGGRDRQQTSSPYVTNK